MTSNNIVLKTHAYTQSAECIQQVLNPIYGENLFHVPADGLCWFYTILLGFFTLSSDFKELFVDIIEKLNVPKIKSLFNQHVSFETFESTQEFWCECFIIIEFLKKEILKYDQIIDTALTERFGGPNINWKSVFKPGKHEGFFHSFRVIEIYFSLIHEIHFKVQICTADLLGITDKYAVSYNNSSTNSFSVYLNSGHYWFVKSPLEFIGVALESEKHTHDSKYFCSALIEHNQSLEEKVNDQEKEIDNLRKQLEFLMTQTSKLESENASLTSYLQDTIEVNSVLKLQLSASDQLFAEEFGRKNSHS